MKILSIFCDMVRPNTLNFDVCKDNSYESIIKKLGGTYYCNCFSHGPDSGRSLACYWSGEKPHENGCDTRIKYPKFYLKCNSFLDRLRDEGYAMYFYTNPNDRVLGILPPGYEKIGNHNKGFDIIPFSKSIEMEQKNLFVQYILTDFHWSIDDYGANKYGMSHGYRVLSETIHNIFSCIDSNGFDYIILFSDHGFKFQKEFDSQPKYLLLNRDRSNVLMFIHKKGEKSFIKNQKLCALIDVYPTVMEMIGVSCESEKQGFSLFSIQEPDYLICDDHINFLPTVNQPIELWSLVTKKRIYFRTKEGYFQDDCKKFSINKKKFDDLLEKEMPSYKEAHKQMKILKLYGIMATDRSQYSNGEQRFHLKRHEILKRIYWKIKRAN